MVYKNVTEEYTLANNELIKASDDYENESYKLDNHKSPLNEIKFENAFNKLFPFDYEPVVSELDEINENDIYPIKNINYVRKVNNLKKSNDDIIGTDINKDISFQERIIDISNVHKIKKTSLGRKRKNSKEKVFHTRNFFDNKTRKIKCLVLEELRSFINKKIREEYKLNKKLKNFEIIKIGPKQFNNSNILFNKKFIHKSLKEIFSADTTIKNRCRSRDSNKKLIEKLLNEKKDIFENIFNLEFLEILDYLVGKKPELIQLNGLTFPEKLKQKEEKDEEYSKSVLYIMENFEKILEEKKHRKPRKKEKKE